MTRNPAPVTGEPGLVVKLKRSDAGTPKRLVLEESPAPGEPAGPGAPRAARRDFREQALAAGRGTGRWLEARRAFTYPVDPVVLRELMRRFPGLRIDPGVRDYMSELAARQREVLRVTQDPSPLWEGDSFWPFQRASIRFLAMTGHSILGHEMGTGKTVIGCGAIRYLGLNRVLVVCPDRLKWSWADHLREWAGRGDVVVLESGRLAPEVAGSLGCDVVQGDRVEREAGLARLLDGPRFVLVVNYDQVRIHRDLFLAGDYDVVVADEAHRIGNRKTQRTKVMTAVFERAPRGWLFTGTPLRRDYTDLWALLHICDPVRFAAFSNFVYLHLNSRPGRFGGLEILGLRDRREFDAMLATYAFCKTKAGVLPDLPPKVYQHVKLLLNPGQRRVYEQMERDFVIAVRRELAGGRVLEGLLKAQTVLAQITRLRQICLSPAILGSVADSAKLDFLEDILAGEFKPSGEPVLIFTFFREFLPYVRDVVARLGLTWAEIVGGQTSTEQRAVEERLACGEVQVVLGTAQSMGEGLNLQAAKTAVFCDRHWVPAVNVQAEDRIHRAGVKTSPKIIYLYHPGTVEEDILASAAAKERKMNETVGAVEVVRRLLQRRGTEAAGEPL